MLVRDDVFTGIEERYQLKVSSALNLFEFPREHVSSSDWTSACRFECG